jgi:hypothetical protein
MTTTKTHDVTESTKGAALLAHLRVSGRVERTGALYEVITDDPVDPELRRTARQAIGFGCVILRGHFFVSSSQETP